MSFYALRSHLPKKIKQGPQWVERQALIDACVHAWSELDFLGVVDGACFESDASNEDTFDSAQAISSRNWVDEQALNQVDFYFGSESSVNAAMQSLEIWPISDPKVQWKAVLIEDEDWNAKWKASFQGIRLECGVSILPPHQAPARDSRFKDVVIIEPGAGFGTGTHETTQLCLEVLSEHQSELKGHHVLDFGSGSGVLSIYATKQGAHCLSVEIDSLARENAAHNAQLNGIAAGAIRQVSHLSEVELDSVQWIVANILKPVLLENAENLCQWIKQPGFKGLILCGLLEKDLPEILEAYGRFFTLPPSVLKKNEWRALVFQ